MDEYWQDWFAAHRAELLAQAREVAKGITRRQETITIEDVRPHLNIPDEIDKRFLGGALRGPEWEHVGYVKGKRRSCHGRAVAVYKLIDHSA